MNAHWLARSEFARISTFALSLILTMAAFCGPVSAADPVAVSSGKTYSFSLSASYDDPARIDDIVNIRNESFKSAMSHVSIDFEYDRAVRADFVTFDEDAARFDVVVVGDQVSPGALETFANQEVVGALGDVVEAALPLSWGVYEGKSVASYGAIYENGKLKETSIEGPPALSAMLCVRNSGGLSVSRYADIKAGTLSVPETAMKSCRYAVQTGPRIIHVSVEEGSAAPTSLCPWVPQERGIRGRCGIPTSNLFLTKARPVSVLAKWSSGEMRYVSLIHFHDDVTLWEIQAHLIGDEASPDTSLRSALAGDLDLDANGMEIEWAIQTVSISVSGLYVKQGMGDGTEPILVGPTAREGSLFSSVLTVSAKLPAN